MAEKGLRRALSSSLHSDDLLSDMELLPASDPPTPGQQVPCSQLATPYTSKVTTQLYASLHQSRQAEAQASSRLEGQRGSALARNAMDADVDMDTLAEELSHRLSASVEASAFRQGAVAESRHISEMENVRCHLQSMLRGSRDVPGGPTVTLESLERKDDDSFESDSTGALLNARPLHDVSPPGSLASFEDLFPRYTSLRLGHFHDPVSQLDPRLLKDALEKEQARRKHCERHIQALQNRILELQQQLAVAVSADQRKDSMIEQLDKTLAKVVEGWNQQQAERTATLRRLQAEKETAEQGLGRQKEKMSELEGRLQQALSTLHREQQLASQYCREKEALEKEKAALSCSLEAERVRGQSLEAEWDLDRRQRDALRATLEEQQRTWVQREKQLEEQLQTAQEESRLHLEKEKMVAQREAQKALEAQQALSTVQAEMQGLQADLEAVRRERDTVKMEMSLLKARFETQKAKLESELKVALEQRVTERLAEVHEDSLRQMSAMREQHRKQLLELSSHHEKELAKQLAQFKLDLSEKEAQQKRLTEDYEHRLSKQRDDLREFKARYRRLEAQRAEMVSQFQAMMQSHWNEALRLFATGGPSLQPSPKAPCQESESDPNSESGFLGPPDPPKKTPKGETLCSNAGMGDGKELAWAKVGPLQPVLHQQTKLQGGSEGPEKRLRESSRPFLPLVPDVGRLSSEFSHILNSSLLSQQGFQQLDPQVDTTIAGPGLNFHPENLAEHPFADERDDSSPELAGNDSEVTQPSTGESGTQGLQPDLNYYMRLLLSHSDFEGSAPQTETCAADSPPRTMNRTQAGNSQFYHERSTALWDPAQSSQHDSHPATQQRRRPKNQSPPAQIWTGLLKPGTSEPLQTERCPRRRHPVPQPRGSRLAPSQTVPGQGETCALHRRAVQILAQDRAERPRNQRRREPASPPEPRSEIVRIDEERGPSQPAGGELRAWSREVPRSWEDGEEALRFAGLTLSQQQQQPGRERVEIASRPPDRLSPPPPAPPFRGFVRWIDTGGASPTNPGLLSS
ncbi:LOW QUALITY PROTEIN: centrobin [Pseudonaja textilis]|uniref:LOW QUALITY PROTEIN: centrobin n=1 Tax=Pseudonaja textilis TaxID=8673 RepID=UPI000EA9095F|nr:LOW QUALITY PROTEIN: centrobin [Pseudonaja textilis]